jgi:hypothetical protein
MLRRVALIITDVSEELSASVIRVARIGELGKTLAITSNLPTLRRNLYFRLKSEEVDGFEDYHDAWTFE